MGYCLWIGDAKSPELHFYGTKLFGYVKEHKALLSFQYLKSLGKLDDHDIFTYGFNNRLTLTAEEARKFMELYTSDYTIVYKKLELLSDDDLKKLLETENDKIVEWW